MHLLAELQILVELVRAARLVGQVGREEFGGVVAFQVGGLVGDHRVGHRVALVEAVAGKRLEHLEDRLGVLFVPSLLLAHLEKPELLLGQLLHLLLAHDAAQDVGLAERVAGEDLGHLHDLLLVDDNAVGALQDVDEVGVRILDRLWIGLPFDVVRDELHGAGPVEGVQGDQVLDVVRVGLAQDVLHAAGLELEHHHRVAGLQHPEGVLVLEADPVHVERGVLLVDQVDAVADQRQRLQSQEVHLHQTAVLDVVLVVLGGLPPGLRIDEQRDVVDQLGLPDHQAAGMGAGVADHPLQLAGDGEEHGLVAAPCGQVLLHLRQLRVHAEGLLEGLQLRVVADEFGDLVGLVIGDVQHPGHVLDRGLGLQGAERGDLRHVVLAVVLGDVVDDVLPELEVEVHVEVRHGDALGIEEPLEQQRVLHRVDVGDVDAVGDDRAGARAASRPHRDAVGLGPVDVVAHDQEIALEVHLDDDAQLVVHAGPVFLGLLLAIAADQALVGEQDQVVGLQAALRVHLLVHLGRDELAVFLRVLDQVHELLVAGLLAEILRRLEDRQERPGEPDLQVAALGHLAGVLDRLGTPGEQLLHLLRGLEVELLAGEAEVALFLQLRAGADAQEHLLRLGVRLLDVVDVVGAHQRHATLMGEPDQQRVGPLLLLKAMVLQLQVVAVAEDRLEPEDPAPGLLVAVVQQVLQDLAGQTGREADDPLAVLLDQLVVDAGTVVLALHPGDGVELHQVVVALVVHGQQDQVVPVAPVALAHFLVGAVGVALRVDVELAADDRLDAGLLAGLVEVDGPEHVAVVGDGQRPHARRQRLLHVVLDLGGAVEQRVVGVVVQVDEARVGNAPERIGHGFLGRLFLGGLLFRLPFLCGFGLRFGLFLFLLLEQFLVALPGGDFLHVFFLGFFAHQLCK